jgi:hypothetical protein
MKKQITYEVIGYDSKKDFKNRLMSWIDDGITTKKEALGLAKILKEENAIIKVQSSDREFIKIFGETE